MSRMKVIALAMVVIALLASAFYWLDFLVAHSETRFASRLSTVSNRAPQSAQSAPALGRVNLRVEGRGELPAALVAELRKGLSAGAYFGAVEVEEGAPQPLDNVIVVKVGGQSYQWSGIYSRAHVEAVALLSTNGDVPLDGERVVRFTGDKQTVVVRGEYDMDDTSWGLLSRKGYTADLGRRFADQIGKSLAAELARHSS